LEREREIAYYADMREVAALRHSFHIDSRLRLEFLSVVSKLLREHEVPVSNRLLSTLILAIPDELPDGNGHENSSGAQLAVRAGSKPKKGSKYPARPVPPPIEPIPPPIEPIPPPIEPIPPPIEPIPPPIEPIPPPIEPIPPPIEPIPPPIEPIPPPIEPIPPPIEPVPPKRYPVPPKKRRRKA
jgi:hypothetical protein